MPGKNRLKLDPATSKRLGEIRQTNTLAEIAVRKILHGMGLRFRVQNRDLPGSPDIANRSRRWAVFVHGCFWHSHPRCSRATVPKRNRWFWSAKFRANRDRDKRVMIELARAGYYVVVVWECQLKRPRVASYALRRLVDRMSNGSEYKKAVPPRRRSKKRG